MNQTNAFMIKTAFLVASKMAANAVLLHIDPLDDLVFEEKISRKNVSLILVSRKKKVDIGTGSSTSLAAMAQSQVLLPHISLTRMSLIKVATTLAFSKDLLEPGSKIVAVVGGQDLGQLDLIQLIDTSKESEIIANRNLAKVAETIKPEIFQAVLNLAIELADKGREGKPIGTIFVVGDHEKVLQLSRQMIINPFKGYHEEERHILSSSLKDTIREFSALDGAFVISDEGTILTAGRYLGAAIDESTLPRGLGSRHLAAAGITALTKAVAFTISESSGDVRLFKDGKIVIHIEKAQSKK